MSTRPASHPDLGIAPFTRWQVAVTETATDPPVCLALANTRNWRRGPAPVERFNAYSDLLHGSAARRLLDAANVAAIARRAAAQPRAARNALARTIALREAIYRLFSERAAGRPLAKSDLAQVVAGFNDAVSRLALVLEDGRLTPQRRDGPVRFDTARLQAALSAVSLLTSDRGQRVKECADDRGCGWLFVDTTRNGSRRYCFSNECGNRARQVAFRHRHREPSPGRAVA
jgi:predicted RNA-binding Zn ribbon-like protein